MELTVGAVLEGKVKSITNFGAFVSLDESHVGMVHISEVANAYVSDIRQHLTEGQDVKVMVIGNENGKINLSIKRLEPRPQRGNAPRSKGNFNHSGPHREGGSRPHGGSFHRDGDSRPNNGFRRERTAPQQNAAPKTSDQIFEEKLKAFMSESDSKISSIKQYSDHRTRGSRRR